MAARQRRACDATSSAVNAVSRGTLTPSCLRSSGVKSLGLIGGVAITPPPAADDQVRGVSRRLRCGAGRVGGRGTTRPGPIPRPSNLGMADSLRGTVEGERGCGFLGPQVRFSRGKVQKGGCATANSNGAHGGAQRRVNGVLRYDLAHGGSPWRESPKSKEDENARFWGGKCGFPEDKVQRGG